MEPPDIDVNPQFVWWGLNWCPECSRRSTPGDTEWVIIEEALYEKVDEECINSALGPNAYGWLENQIYSGVFMDDDVYNEPDWDYARGYWVPFSLRYQYWGKAIGIASQIVSTANKREIAITMIHETSHEFGYTDEDEALAESLGWLCSQKES